MKQHKKSRHEQKRAKERKLMHKLGINHSDWIAHKNAKSKKR